MKPFFSTEMGHSSDMKTKTRLSQSNEDRLFRKTSTERQIKSDQFCWFTWNQRKKQNNTQTSEPERYEDSVRKFPHGVVFISSVCLRDHVSQILRFHTARLSSVSTTHLTGVCCTDVRTRLHTGLLLEVFHQSKMGLFVKWQLQFSPQTTNQITAQPQDRGQTAAEEIHCVRKWIWGALWFIKSVSLLEIYTKSSVIFFFFFKESQKKPWSLTFLYKKHLIWTGYSAPENWNFRNCFSIFHQSSAKRSIWSFFLIPAENQPQQTVMEAEAWGAEGSNNIWSEAD